MPQAKYILIFMDMRDSILHEDNTDFDPLEEFINTWVTPTIHFDHKDVYLDKNNLKWYYRKYNEPTLNFLKDKMRQELKHLINHAETTKTTIL